jgi:hypothetical protein
MVFRQDSNEVNQRFFQSDVNTYITNMSPKKLKQRRNNAVVLLEYCQIVNVKFNVMRIVILYKYIHLHNIKIILIVSIYSLFIY